eukprot:98783_1
MADLDDWVKQNKLPEELADVFYEEGINSVNELSSCSQQKMWCIIKALEANMQQPLTSVQQQHLINCFENLQLNQIKYESSEENKILNKLNTYDDAYSQSLQWIKHKQQHINEEKCELNKEFKTMFTSFQNKTENMIQKQLIKYQHTLSDNFTKQKEIHNKIKIAKQKYTQDKQIAHNNSKNMSQFNDMIKERLNKYNPTECINNNNIFDTLKKK